MDGSGTEKPAAAAWLETSEPAAERASVPTESAALELADAAPPEAPAALAGLTNERLEPLPPAARVAGVTWIVSEAAACAGLEPTTKDPVPPPYRFSSLLA